MSVRVAPLLLALALGACAAPHSALDPRSDAAAAIEQLWWILFVVCVAIFLIVLGLYAYAVWRPRSGDAAAESATGRMLTLIVGGGAVIPALILLGLTVATVETSSRASHAWDGTGPEPMVIEVVGHQFWWEVRYPDAGVVTANEIHLPAGRATRLILRSDDVIHSFWVPQLHGKMDLTPGRATELLLAPRETGIFRGFCTEFCGPQHALMQLMVFAEPEAEFQRWLDEQARPASAPADPQRAMGAAVFVEKECSLCHLVRGAEHGPPPAQAGPDLTHVASRSTLAAAVVPNTRARLMSWILDPHVTKPGVRMPATTMARNELDALVAYLEGLR